MDDLGHIRWEKKDFKKHGTLAKYLIGECRCKKCKERILNTDSERLLKPKHYFN
jgi:hypothetical protein